MQNLSNVEQEIIQFINNPKEENVEKIYEEIQKLCSSNYESKIVYSSSDYCALSGEELKEKYITIDNYRFSPNSIQEYYLRNGILDVSIGNLIFNHYDGELSGNKEIELTWDILKSIFEENLENQLEEAYSHFSKRLEKPGPLNFSQTERSGIISEQMIQYSDERNQSHVGISQKIQ